ncbi:salivary glue protein Sgs-3-like [Mytilus californianus]|uniref:salivary glue protein Sgs-3-like n=1 Tax=Mytilus californianus TaxID=6549 RepID=UPI0022470F34|nr:salivary glue protein Sgs-3-like [Mytilus californianus]
MLPGQCPLMDYSCPSACWFTDTSTGCITCACKVGQLKVTEKPKTLPTTDEPTTSVPTTNANVNHHGNQEHQQTTRKLVLPNAPTQQTPIETTEHRTTLDLNNKATEQNEIISKGQNRRVCLPIEDSCPLHCLNYDRQTFCALCECPQTTTSTTTATTIATTADTATVTTKSTTTVPSTTASSQSLASTCKPLYKSCPIECRTYDTQTYCPVCRCQTTTPPQVPTTDRCVSLPVDCKTECVKLGLNGCPVCQCPNVTVNSNSADVNVTKDLTCPPIDRNCRKECITYDPKSFCPLCQCKTKEEDTAHN